MPDRCEIVKKLNEFRESSNVNQTTTQSNNIIYYQWTSAKGINNTYYPILMLKFADNHGINVYNNIQYSIQVKGENNNNTGIVKNGSTLIGLGVNVFNKNDLMNINTNGYYIMNINIIHINNDFINDQATITRVPMSQIIPSQS